MHAYIPILGVAMLHWQAPFAQRMDHEARVAHIDSVDMLGWKEVFYRVPTAE